MFSNVTMQAFLIGIISAVSLPLGAITAKYWQPRSRAIAFLMAFGAGALLAALTIDLVGEALHREEFLPMAAGCILGGVLFVILNQIVNHHGGFLRKSSTMINYLQRLRQLRFQGILGQMKRLPIFGELSKQEELVLVEKAITRAYPKGSTLFRYGDPGDRIYIIEEGEIELRDPANDMRLVKVLEPGTAFGWMSLLTGSVHQSVAVTKTDVQVWVWSREDFNSCLRQSGTLAKHLCDFIQTAPIEAYLSAQQGMSVEQTRAWMQTTSRIIREEGVLPMANALDNQGAQFKQVLQHIQRLPIFENLTPADHELIASRVFLKKHEEGHTFFHQHEYADRMFIVKEGEVSLSDPH
ncbi:MAG: cyclic nucleotide-binding domain-containing protein, partial [Candidatus Omnitrophica bacterium]|nr:cyclic nucleotide-binding domain-containing protein [Candidatus Omnitrophota bacterium]